MGGLTVGGRLVLQVVLPSVCVLLLHRGDYTMCCTGVAGDGGGKMQKYWLAYISCIYTQLLCRVFKCHRNSFGPRYLSSFHSVFREKDIFGEKHVILLCIDSILMTLCCTPAAETSGGAKHIFRSHNNIYNK